MTNHKRFSLAKLALYGVALIALALACSKSESSAPAVDIGGDWDGDWQSKTGRSGTLSLDLTDNQGAVSGKISLTDSPCLDQASLEGSVSGHTVSLTTTSGSDTMKFTATVHQDDTNTMSGSYRIVSGSCKGDSGTFSVTSDGSPSQGDGGLLGNNHAGAGGSSTVGSGGTGGSAGVVHSGGSGGNGGNTVGSPLGGPCDADIDCSTGLTCLSAKSNDWYSGGPSHGYCTVNCAADPTLCDPYPGTLCVSGTTAAEAYCFESCTPGTSAVLEEKCQTRADVACTQVSTDLSVCLPSCGSDSQCPEGRFCDLANGVCLTAQPQGDPIGSSCDPAATTNTCQGFCTDFGGGFAACSGFCTLGLDYAGCGFDPSAGVAPGTPVCLPLADTDGINDLGLCVQRCNSGVDCRHPGAHCEPFPDTATQDAFQSQGLCVPTPPDAGAGDGG